MSDVSPATIDWALVGFGSGGRIFHAPLIESTPGMRLNAVVTRNPARREALAAAFPAAAPVDDLAAAAALGAVGVTISTPPATHLPLALAAIELGLHVVVDKPFALDLHETRRIVAAAHEAGVRAFPYFNRRWDGDFRTVCAVTESGRIGDVRRFESRLDRFRPVKPGWSGDPHRGGGLLLDLGPHLVDQAIVLLGPVRSVQARLEALRPGATAEDGFSLTLTHSSGARSVLAASLAAPTPGPRFLVQGTAGGIRVEGFDGQEAQLKAGGSPASLGDRWGVDHGRSAFVRRAPGGSTGDGAADEEPVVVGPGRWDLFYPAVGASLTAGSAPPTGPADALATAAVLDVARMSAQQGRELPIELAGGTGGPTYQPRPAARPDPNSTAQ